MMTVLKSITTYKIFIVFFLVRFAFYLFGGSNHLELSADAPRYDVLSNQILEGNYNLDIGLFIVAPFYPYFLALIKLLFGSQWIVAFTLIQIAVASLSGVYFYKLAKLIFTDERVTNYATLLYAIFPLTLYWTHTVGQESLFQSFLIFTIYTLVNFLITSTYRNLIYSAILFSFCFLTKSHILIFSPFIVLSIFIYGKRTLIQKAYSSVMYGIICLLFTIPYGYYNYKVNDVYVLSSNGVEMFFWVGHNKDSYTYSISPPPMNSEEYKRLQAMHFEDAEAEYMNKLSHKIKQPIYLQKASKWIKENPNQYFELVWYNFIKFMTPGVGINHYTFKKWLLSFLMAFPIYFFGYIGIFNALKKDFKKHFWVFGLFMTMLFFSVVFYSQTRFRTITLEPFYILYSVYGLFVLKQFYQSLKIRQVQQ